MNLIKSSDLEETQLTLEHEILSEINREGRDFFENSKLICRVAHDELLNDIN